MTALQSSDRFFMPEVSLIFWVPTILALTSIPTRPELTAGTDLSGEIAAVSGFLATSNFIDAPDFKHRFVSKIPGRINAADSALTFYGSQDGQDVRTLLERNQRGFLVFMDGGDVPTQPMDIFEVRVASLGKQRTADEQPYQIVVGFGILHPPVEDATIPALT